MKTSLLTLNDTIVTGNFTVFHARLLPFPAAISPEQLAETFKSFVEKSIDYDVIAAFRPTYDRRRRLEQKKAGSQGSCSARPLSCKS